MTPLSHVERVIAVNHDGHWQVTVRRFADFAVGEYSADFAEALRSAQEQLQISASAKPISELRRSVFDLRDLLT